MADFSIPTLFVFPVGQTALPSSGSTQDLTKGQIGFFRPDFSVATAANVAAANYFIVAQGRENILLGSKKSDKIKGCPSATCSSNVKTFYKVAGCPTAANQIMDISGFSVKCGDTVTLTIRAFSSYLNSLFFNGLTRSVTVQAPCCECGGDACTDVDVPSLIDAIILKLNQKAPGQNPDNIALSTFFTFERVGNDANAILRIQGKALTQYGVPCDIAAFPYEYDRMTFRGWVYTGPATTADFIVSDSCNTVATATITQSASYPKGMAAEIAQMEKNYYSYQAGIMKHLNRNQGWNQNFESYVDSTKNYDTYYIKFGDYKPEDTWGEYVKMDNEVILAIPSDSAARTALETLLAAALGTLVTENTCITTTTTTAPPTTTTTTTAG